MAELTVKTKLLFNVSLELNQDEAKQLCADLNHGKAGKLLQPLAQQLFEAKQNGLFEGS